MTDLTDLELRSIINTERLSMLAAESMRLAQQTMRLADVYEALMPQRIPVRRGRTENMARGTVWKLHQ